jgi:hypothetical protein
LECCPCCSFPPEFRSIAWSGKTRAIWLAATIDSKHAGLALTASKASSLTNFRMSLTSRSRPRIQGEGMCSAARSGEIASTDLSHLLYNAQSPGPHSIFFLILSEGRILAPLLDENSTVRSHSPNHRCGSFSRSRDLPVFTPPPKLPVQERYNQGLFFCVLSGSVQGIAGRPLPCNYNVIQFVCAPLRRKRGFESVRGANQFNDFRAIW